MSYKNIEFTIYSSNIPWEPTMCWVLVQELPVGLFQGRKRNNETHLPSPSHYALHDCLPCIFIAVKIYLEEETIQLKFLLKNNIYSNNLTRQTTKPKEMK